MNTDNRLYHENQRALLQLNPSLLQFLDALSPDHSRIEPSQSGLLTLIYKKNNQEFYIHSKFKPAEETSRLLQKANLTADHIILFGLGLGYHLESIMANKAKGTRVLLVEPELEILHHSLYTLNWANLMNRGDFFYCFGRDLNLLSNTINRFIDVTTFDSMEIIELPSEVRLMEDFFVSARGTIDNEIKTLLYDFKTRLAEEALVPRNILKNIDGLLHTRPVKSLKKRFADKVAFIVSAGPSLDKNILLLKKVRDRGVIICVDTALKPLLKRGINPHFTVTADPSYKNYLHLQGTENDMRYFLVSDTGISTQVYRDFRDRLFSISMGKPIVKMLEQYIGEIGELEAWGSVISVALHFAVYIGCDPIVFLGQDFAFSGMRNHCRGTSWEDSWLEYNRDLGLMQRQEKQSISGIAKVSETLDIHGNTIMTSDKLLLYKNFLLKMVTSIPGKHFINASEGGILGEIEIKSLHSVLDEFVFKQEKIDFSHLSEIPTLYSKQKKEKLIRFFEGKAVFFKKYKKKLENILSELGNTDALSFHPVSLLLDKSQEVKDLLYSTVQNAEIVEMWSQGPIFEFLKRYKKLNANGFNETTQKEWVSLFRDYFLKLSPLISSINESLGKSIELLRCRQ